MYEFSVNIFTPQKKKHKSAKTLCKKLTKYKNGVVWLTLANIKKRMEFPDSGENVKSESTFNSETQILLLTSAKENMHLRCCEVSDGWIKLMRKVFLVRFNLLMGTNGFGKPNCGESETLVYCDRPYSWLVTTYMGYTRVCQTISIFCFYVITFLKYILLFT